MIEVQLSFLLAAISLLAYFVWASELRSSGELLILWFQEENSVVFRLVFQLLDILLEVGLLVLSALLYMLHQRGVGAVGMMAGFLAASLAGILKYVIAEPRPFWEYEEVQALVCPCDYGMPSGHALSVGCSLFVLSRLLIQAPPKKIVVIVLGISIISIDRLYLGVHYYHQLVLGFALAQCLASVLIKIFEKSCCKYWAAGCVGSFSLGLAIIFNFSPEWIQTWTDNYAEKECGDIDPNINKETAAYSMTFLMLVAGILIGYPLLDRQIPPLTSRYLCFSVLGTVAVVIYAVAVAAILRLISLTWPILMMVGLNMMLSGFAFSYLLPEFIARKMSTTSEDLQLKNYTEIVSA